MPEVYNLTKRAKSSSVMAFKSKDLSVLAYANGFTLWHYTTVDPATDVDTAGYFNTYGRIADRADLDFVLHLGDYIYEYPTADGTPQAGILVVLSNSGGTVDVANLTQVGASNSD